MHSNFYDLYLEELEGIPPFTSEEETAIIQKMLKGDKTQNGRLIEGNLKKVVEFSKNYEGQGLPIEDLIQEANMALTMAVSEYKEGDFGAFLDLYLKTALKTALDAQSVELKVEEELAARVNVLKDVSQRMAEELCREATIEELAQKMKMTEQEIKNIMKITLDAISINRQ